MNQKHQTNRQPGRLAAFLQLIGWRLRWNWDCVGGSYIQPAHADSPMAYRFVWCHKHTHEVRLETKKITPDNEHNLRRHTRRHTK